MLPSAAGDGRRPAFFPPSGMTFLRCFRCALVWLPWLIWVISIFIYVYIIFIYIHILLRKVCQVSYKDLPAGNVVVKICLNKAMLNRMEQVTVQLTRVLLTRMICHFAPVSHHIVLLWVRAMSWKSFPQIKSRKKERIISWTMMVTDPWSNPTFLVGGSSGRG